MSIRSSVIPAVCCLQRSSPEKAFTDVLGLELVMPLLSSFQIDPDFLCVDMQSSDIFFNSLKKK